MMKKLLLLFLALHIGIVSNAGNVNPANPQEPADEGMWLPILLSKYNFAQMKKLGMKLSEKDIYDVNKGSLKDAVLWFGGGCTGEIVSDKGLLLTNHHCGYDAIADLSTVKNNHLKNGFWAKSMAEELPAKDLSIQILVRMEDVSKSILPMLNGLDEKQKAAKIKEIGDSIVAAAKKDTHYEAFVRDMFKNNQFILFVFEKFTDIRLVGTPPESIGKFGGDTDNWMWPRQTGDFSMFRIYAGKDNKPAAYSSENVPYKPKKFLSISLKGVNPGDFTMVFGFPGRTNRYENSYGISMAVNEVNPSIVKLRERRLELMLDEMQKDEAVRLQQASKYASLANYWKFFMGETEQVKRLMVENEKVAFEKKFQEWAANKDAYKNVMSDWKTLYTTYLPYAKHGVYMSQGIYGIQVVAAARNYAGIEKALMDNTYEAKKATFEKSIEDFQKSFEEIYNMASDKKIAAAMLQYFYEDIPKEQQPAILEEIIAKYGSGSAKITSTKSEIAMMAFTKFADEMTANTMFNKPEKVKEFMKSPSLAVLQNDPAYRLYKAFSDNYVAKIKKYDDEFGAKNYALGSVFIKGMQEMEPGKAFYPDANSTMRLTYGSIKDYDAKDGVHFKHYCTVNGILEKYKPGDYEFDAPVELIDMIKKKDFGQYADPKLGTVVTCFLSDNDITGGNSGSPVLNGNGELIGIAFDGNWEAMSGNLVFDQRYKRTISVDIRYVLFIVDKLGGASNLISEMKIVK